MSVDKEWILLNGQVGFVLSYEDSMWLSSQKRRCSDTTLLALYRWMQMSNGQFPVIKVSFCVRHYIVGFQWKEMHDYLT